MFSPLAVIWPHTSSEALLYHNAGSIFYYSHSKVLGLRSSTESVEPLAYPATAYLSLQLLSRGAFLKEGRVRWFAMDKLLT